MKNLPNLITTLRILLIPVFLTVFWSESGFSLQWAMFIMALAGISDVVDGHLARKMNLVTETGKILDPLADKLMVVAALTSFYLTGLVPLWLFALIVVKEIILVAGSSFVVLKRDYDVSANFGGKIATVSIYTALFAVSLNLPGQTLFLYIAGLLASLSLVNYLYGYLTSMYNRKRL